MVMTRYAPLRRLLHNLQPWLVLHLIFGARIIGAASKCVPQMEAEGYIGDVANFSVCCEDIPQQVVMHDLASNPIIWLSNGNIWNKGWMWWWSQAAGKLHVYHRVKSGVFSGKFNVQTKGNSNYSGFYELNLTNHGYPEILLQLQNDELSLNETASNHLSCGTKQSPETIQIYMNSGEMAEEGLAVQSANSPMHELVYDFGPVDCSATGIYRCEAPLGDGVIKKTTLGVTHYSCPPLFVKASLKIPLVEIGRLVPMEVVVLSANPLDVGFSRWFKDGTPLKGTVPHISITRDDWQTYTVFWNMTAQDEADLAAKWELRLESLYEYYNDRQTYYGSFKFNLIAGAEEASPGMPISTGSSSKAKDTSKDTTFIIIVAASAGGGLLLVIAMIIACKCCRARAKPASEMPVEEEVIEQEEIEVEEYVVPESVTHGGETNV